MHPRSGLSLGLLEEDNPQLTETKGSVKCSPDASEHASNIKLPKAGPPSTPGKSQLTKHLASSPSTAFPFELPPRLAHAD